MTFRGGTYLLDAEGRLHPQRHRARVKAVALVRVRPIQTFAGVLQTADNGGGCEGRAPEGTRESPARATVAPECPPTPPPTGSPAAPLHEADRPALLDLSAAPSAMEAAAARWRSPVAAGEAAAERRAALTGNGLALCRCGGRGLNDTGPVPAWFGRDCIEAGCPLRATA